MELTDWDQAGEELARVVRHPLRQRLLFAYAEAETSPSKVAAALGEPVNLVSYHTTVLCRAGCIELVRTEPRRGSEEHFYRAVVPVQIEDVVWDRLPVVLRRVLVRQTLEECWRDAGDAVPQGGMDEPTAHVSRTFLDLDEQGRMELASLLRATFDKANRIAHDSSTRDGDGRATVELVILSFRSASRP